MIDRTQLIAFWLLPAPPARAFLSRLIGDLAERFDAPVFEPHLTLYGAPFDDEFRFETIAALPMPASPELEVTGIEYSEKFTKTLFVQFRKNAEIMELVTAVARATGNKNGHKLIPHLSLIYKTLPTEVKAELAREIQLPFERVRFDGLQAISTPARIESRQGVEAWQTLWERCL